MDTYLPSWKYQKHFRGCQSAQHATYQLFWCSLQHSLLPSQRTAYYSLAEKLGLSWTWLYCDFAYLMALLYCTVLYFLFYSALWWSYYGHHNVTSRLWLINWIGSVGTFLPFYGRLHPSRHIADVNINLNCAPLVYIATIINIRTIHCDRCNL